MESVIFILEKSPCYSSRRTVGPGEGFLILCNNGLSIGTKEIKKEYIYIRVSDIYVYMYIYIYIFGFEMFFNYSFE
jgi:hypothetical protein